MFCDCHKCLMNSTIVVRFRKSKNCREIVVRSFVKLGPGSWPVFFLLVCVILHVFVPRFRRQLRHNLFQQSYRQVWFIPLADERGVCR